MNFYQLDISQEDENNQVKKTSLNDNSPSDERNGRDSSVADKENEWPACKKRKVDFNRKSSNGDLVDIGKCEKIFIIKFERIISLEYFNLFDNCRFFIFS